MAWKDRYPLIMNPNARSERAKRAHRFVMKNPTEFVIYATKSPEEAGELASFFANKNEKIVIAAGGDGTINTVVRGLSGSDTALGILPTGTMNVFARELGIPSAKLSQAYSIIKEEHIVEVDLFEVNGMPFAQMAGIGLDARIIEETSEEQKKALGPIAYGIAAAKVFGENPPKMTVVLDDEVSIEGVCVLVGNGGLYGGQFTLFEEADNSDNLMDVLIFKEAGYRGLLDFLKGLKSLSSANDFSEAKSIEYRQVSKMHITSQTPIPLELDGEYAGRHTSFNFKGGAELKKLKVVCPQEPVVNEWEESLSALAPFLPWLS